MCERRVYETALDATVARSLGAAPDSRAARLAFGLVKQFADAIAAGASGPDLEAMPIPESFRAAHVLRNEQTMFEGRASAEKDPREAMHIGEVATPGLALLTRCTWR